MSLRTKMALMVLLAAGILVGVAQLVQRLVIYPSFIALERDEAQRDLERSVEALRREIQHLDVFARDWATSDDTYRFADGRNPSHPSSRFPPATFAETNLNLVYIVDARGVLLWGRVYAQDPLTRVYLPGFLGSPVPRNHPLLQFDKSTRAVAGVTLTAHGPLLVDSRPILSSNRRGPRRGTLIVGRFLTEELIGSMAQRARVDLKVWPARQEDLAPAERKLLRHVRAGQPYFADVASRPNLDAYTLFAGIDRSSLLLRVRVPRDISGRGRASVYLSQLATITIGITFMLVLLAALQVTIIGPISRLTAHAVSVARTDDLSARIDLKRKDEIGALAREFDRMVEQLATSRQELMDQTYHSGMAEMASGVLHNVRNALSPMLARIELLRQAIDRVPIEQIERAELETAGIVYSEKRRQDLARFLDLARKSLVTTMDETRVGLDEIGRRARQIEQVLAEQSRVNRVKPPLQAVPLIELVRDAVAMMPDALRSTLTVEIDPSIGRAGTLRVSRIILLQVFANLFINAAEAVRRGGGSRAKVRVWADREQTEDGKPSIHIRFQDNGPGIAPEDIERIFQRGFSTKPDSSGLGLHWSANAVSSMGGRLYSESGGLGSGACMHVIVPVLG